jgi:hypothetical protein
LGQGEGYATNANAVAGFESVETFESPRGHQFRRAVTWQGSAGHHPPTDEV